MAGTFQVFVDGATTPGPDAARALAEAMATRYGLPAAELIGRLGTGRFRVKANVDRATADDFARGLRSIGARCTIEDSATPTPPPPRPASSSLPPLAPHQTLPPPLGARAQAPSPTNPPQFQSGLSAAFSGQLDRTNLGALSGDDQPLSLASLDGEDDRAPAPPAASFAPPGEPPPIPPPAPVASGREPRITIKPPSNPAPASTELIDMFAPPDAAQDDMRVELADDELEDRARKRSSAAPPLASPVLAAPAAAAAMRYARQSAPPVDTAQTPVRTGRFDPATRFALGIALAIVLGFVPAHMVASMRERSAFAAIDSKVIASQASAESPEDYAALDGMRATQLDHKKSERRSIAIMAMVIWAVVGAGVGYGFFRAVPE